MWYISLIVSVDLLAPSFAPGSISQGGGAVRGALPRYPEQWHHTTAQQAWHYSVLQVPVPSAYPVSWSLILHHPSRLYSGGTKYLVRWTVYGPEHDEWLHEDELGHAGNILDQYKQANGLV